MEHLGFGIRVWNTEPYFLEPMIGVPEGVL